MQETAARRPAIADAEARDILAAYTGAHRTPRVILLSQPASAGAPRISVSRSDARIADLAIMHAALGLQIAALPTEAAGGDAA